MSRAPRQQRTVTGRRLSLERLESRQLLSVGSGTVSSPTLSIPGSSGDVLPAGSVATADATTVAPSDATPSGAQTVITTDPADGASLTQSPSSLIINFPQVVSFLPYYGDVQVEQVLNDGSTNQLFSDVTPPNATFPSGTQESIPLDPALQPGHYRIVLVGGSVVSEYLSQVFYPGLWDGNLDQTLADFTIQPPVVNPPATLSNPTAPLGTIGIQVQSISGSLDLSSQENVDLYEFTLGSGHFWRLGVQLEAQQIDSPLRGALTLFDSSGTALATSTVGTGGPDSPADPYLFSGLKPGLYYIGVSGAGNLGEQSGGYDPRGSGTFGTSGNQQAGGKYTLDLFADPADTPTRVLGVGLQWGDRLGTSPTGLVLGFSGSIDVNSLNTAGNNHSAFWVVDQSGHAWFLTPTSYDASLAQVSFVFDQPLPPGRYTLFNSTSEGFKDLAGWAPVAPGLPQGALATWTIPPITPPVVPGNLGVVWPSQQDGVADSERILPGQVATSQVYVPMQGLYTLRTSVSQGTLAIERAGPDGLVVVDPGSQGTSHQYTLDLEPGVYVFTFRNLGTQEALADWQIAPSSIDHENLTDNGVGQSVALGLRLINPTSSSLTTELPPGLSPSPDSTGPVSAPAPLPETAAPSAPGTFTLAFAVPTLTSLSASSVSVSPLSGSLFVTVNSGLLGSPTAAAGPIEAGGQTVPAGMIALANGAQGLLPGIAGRGYGTAEDRDPTNPDQGALTKGLPAAASGLATMEADPSPASTGDVLALNKADRITELAGRLGRWFGLKTGQEGATVDGALAESDLLARNETDPGRGPADGSAESSTERMTEADLGMPTGLIVVAAAAYRLRQLAGRWWRRTRGQVRVPSRPEVSPPGPRSRSFRGSHGSHAGQPACGTLTAAELAARG
jgi:hypothetical protein